MDKSASDTEIEFGQQSTPLNFISQRSKRKREDDYFNEISQVKAMLTTFMKKHSEDTKNHNAILTEIQQTNLNIENSVAFLTSQNEEFKRKIENLEGELKDSKNYIILLEGRMEDMQRHSRKANLEIKNVPKKQHETKEDLIEMTVCLSESIGSQLKKEDIKDIYRIKGKKENQLNSPIIVETSSTLMKNRVLKMAKAYNVQHKEKLTAKLLGFRTEHTHNTPIYVSEQLTAKASRLHFLARDLVKSNKYKYCWTAYGNVFVRKDDNSAVIPIKSESQIQVLQKVSAI